MLLRFASAQIGGLGEDLVLRFYWSFPDSMSFRMGFTRLAESSIRKIKGKAESDSLGPLDKILSSTIGGALATWNQPIEVIRVEVSIFPAFSESYAAQLIFRCNPWQRALRTPTDLRNLRS